MRSEHNQIEEVHNTVTTEAKCFRAIVILSKSFKSHQNRYKSVKLGGIMIKIEKMCRIEYKHDPNGKNVWNLVETVNYQKFK